MPRHNPGHNPNPEQAWVKARRARIAATHTHHAHRRTRKCHVIMHWAHIIALPVTWTVALFNPKDKHNVETIIGACLMLTGSTLAVSATKLCPTWLPHNLYDMGAYGLHGAGAAPIIKRVGKKLGVDA